MRVNYSRVEGEERLNCSVTSWVLVASSSSIGLFLGLISLPVLLGNREHGNQRLISLSPVLLENRIRIPEGAVTGRLEEEKQLGRPLDNLFIVPWPFGPEINWRCTCGSVCRLR
jgi:hypothetical protein